MNTKLRPGKYQKKRKEIKEKEKYYKVLSRLVDFHDDYNQLKCVCSKNKIKKR